VSVVLAGVDGSAVSRDCLRAAVVMAELLAAAPEAAYIGAAAPAELQRLAAATGVRLTCRPGEAAAALVEALGAPEVVMGVLGSSGAGDTKVPQGRTAAAVMSASDKPLLIVPPGSFPPSLRRLHRVLVPLDDRRESARAVVPVLRLLAGAGLELVVVHVFDRASVPSFWDQPQHATTAWEREFLHRNLPFHLTRLRLRQGTPAAMVVQAGADERTDLVVMGWSRDLSPGRAATLEHQLAHGLLPLLLVPVTRDAVIDVTGDAPVRTSTVAEGGG
jgi:nucleotide-binding universal stress UspA family protein